MSACSHASTFTFTVGAAIGCADVAAAQQGGAAFLADVARSQTQAENEEKSKFLRVRERMVAKAT